MSKPVIFFYFRPNYPVDVIPEGEHAGEFLEKLLEELLFLDKKFPGIIVSLVKSPLFKIICKRRDRITAITFAIADGGKWGYSVCIQPDHFCRKTGREQALARMNYDWSNVSTETFPVTGKDIPSETISSKRPTFWERVKEAWSVLKNG